MVVCTHFSRSSPGFAFTLIGFLFLGLLTEPASAQVNSQESCPMGVECDYFPSTCDAGACDAICNDNSAWCESFYSCLSDSGISVSNNLTQYYFGTVGGGLDQTDRYGGHGDYVANMDLGKLGVHEGLFLKLRAEHRFGRSIGEPAGVFFPPTLPTELPVADSRDLYLTNVLFTQFCSERFAIYAGKLDTLDGDANAYASGRGITQFSNVAFIANPIALRTIPYASLGCGFVILGNQGEPLFNFLVMNPTDTADTDGFDELFADGVALSAELRFATPLMGKPGHQLFAGTWSSRDYVSLGQDPRILLPNIPINRADGSWSLYWNTDQALWVDPTDAARHWGYFARAAIADDSTNPVNYLLSAGLGGASPLRTGDSFGVGYFYSGTSEEIGPILEAAALGPIGDSQGVEVFYRSQLTQSISVTPDFQWLSQARQRIDDAYILGVRMNIAF
ncbi:Carbohydrate-selective porin, OprB family [Neorhodopirellula pilleata]|uniref:Carbohydrate-selective porin, OprB family n=2 Tax=Neorhodopirellula pilleata TaxID=2714738 RepID=A0A5C6ATX3_9BACT|nr:Carbohydrate-selective porin, OprB family [Neorhodopirellula pilleata]